MWLILLLLLLFITFLLINSSSVFITSINFTNSLIELIITLFCILYLLFIISPALILLLDSDILIVPSFIIYTIGYQWAWSLNIYFNGTLSTYVDHCLVSSSLIKWIKPIIIQTNNSSIIIPLYSLVRLLIMSYDVIHSVGFYSVGIKMDATPAKINLSQSIRTLKKGQYRGFCFELCGYGHTSMLLTSNIIWYLNNPCSTVE